jgi:hypothetical protein
MEKGKKRPRANSNERSQIVKRSKKERDWSNLIPSEIWTVFFELSDGATRFVLSFTTKFWYNMLKKDDEKNKFSAGSIVDVFSKCGFLNLLAWWDDLGFFLGSGVCVNAATDDDMAMMKWAIGKGCVLTRYVSETAASKGNVSMLKWLVENGCPTSGLVCAHLAVRGDVETLEWAVINGCECGIDAGGYASLSGRLEVLKWMKEKNLLVCDRYLVDNAVKGGHMKVLKWLSISQPHLFYSAKTTEIAATFGRLKALKWLIERGCRWDEWVLAMAARYGHFELFKWALENGCNYHLPTVLGNLSEEYCRDHEFWMVMGTSLSKEELQKGRDQIKKFIILEE